MNKKEIWVFDAGASFSSNPKWLFMYLENTHKEIEKYWLSTNKECIKYVRKLGFNALLYKSKKAKKIMKKCTTYVVEQCKENIPNELKDKKILNLWHGVGLKAIERKVKTGFLAERVAKKYIQYNEQYINNQLFLVTSPFMEKHFLENCGLRSEQLIRGGYPRCLYQGNVKTFNHDIKKEKGLSKDTKIVAYMPTFRDGNKDNFFSLAMPNMDKLIETLERNNQLLIFKLHPLMLKDSGYIAMKEKYENHKNILIWDSNKDIYEIFNQIDIAIIDYSSIFYDLLAAGVKNYIRYIFDYNDYNEVRNLLYDYKEMTCGTECYSFDSLINVLDNFKSDENSEKLNKITKLFWEYSNKNSLEDIIQKTLKFKVSNKELKKLYSFDIFDTLIQRKCGTPEGIFYLIKEKMIDSNLGFKTTLIQDFVNVRKNTERYLRDRNKKDPAKKISFKFEITLHEIYSRIALIYNLTKEQTEFLEQTEIESELENVLPIEENINRVVELIKNNETVILISDMYLPHDCIVKMLEKVNKTISKLPLFLSSDSLLQKSTGKLFLEAYYNFDYYNFKEWIHCGDNKISDCKMPSKHGIKTERFLNENNYNEYETEIKEKICSYDSFVFANLLQKFRDNNNNELDYFIYSRICTYWVPYVNWVVKDSINKGIDTLYFVSRDGYYLKIIADELIKLKKFNIKTKYIYGSRKAWRVPSYINEVDEEFFAPYGNITDDIRSFKDLLEALLLTEKEFDDIFPLLSYIKNSTFNVRLMKKIRSEIKNSEKYKEKLLEIATEKRKIVLQYFKQEINFEEKYAFVDYWGRGYTQNSLHRLLKACSNNHKKTEYYYARSIYPSEDNIIRNNFVSNIYGLTIIETLFSNIEDSSVKGYKHDGKRIIPDMSKNEIINKDIFNAILKIIPIFVNDNYNDMYYNEDGFGRNIFEFSLRYMNENMTDNLYLKYIATLNYSATMYGKVREFAPKLKMQHFIDLFKAIKIEKQTSNIDMTLARSNIFYKNLYYIYKYIFTHKKILKALKKILLRK